MAEANASQEYVRLDVNHNCPRNFFVSKLTKALRRRINPTKAPAHFADSLEKACKTNGPSLSKTLLKAHINVYLAYFLTEENLEGLAKLSAEDLTFVTNAVACASRDDTIDQFITHFFKTSQRGQKYQAMLDSINREQAMSSEPPSTDSRSSKRPRISSAANDETTCDQQRFVVGLERAHDREQFRASMAPGQNRERSIASVETTRDREQSTTNVETPIDQEQFGASMGPVQSRERSMANVGTTHDREEGTADIPDNATTHIREHSTANNANHSGHVIRYFSALYKSIGFDVDTSKQLCWPATSLLEKVFPLYLTRITSKGQDGAAWVRVYWASPAESVLEIFVSATATQNIAKELFDLNIAAENQVRSVLLDNNVLIEMKDSITLSGTHIDKVAKLLGAQAAEAYQLTPTRIAELAQGIITTTYCLSMEIWPDADCPSRLMLRGDVSTLSMIANQLWPDLSY